MTYHDGVTAAAINPFSALGVLVLALAVFRATRLVVDDLIGEPVRDAWHWIFRARRAGIGDYFIDCPWCVSIWIAALALVGVRYAWGVVAWLALLLALSAVAGLLSRIDA
jgi:hypothetical protein